MPEETDLYTSTIDGLTVRTGDIICTANGSEESFVGAFWRAVGVAVPGDVDHVLLYVGPAGRCVEAGPQGVIAYDVPDQHWDAERMHTQRGFVDTLYGVVSPVDDLDVPEVERQTIRSAVAHFCLDQAAANKPYNPNFLDTETTEAFYCSQLLYHAYRPHNINLNTRAKIAEVLDSELIVFPQEIWDGFKSRTRLPETD